MGSALDAKGNGSHGARKARCAHGSRAGIWVLGVVFVAPAVE